MDKTSLLTKTENVITKEVMTVQLPTGTGMIDAGRRSACVVNIFTCHYIHDGQFKLASHAALSMIREPNRIMSQQKVGPRQPRGVPARKDNNSDASETSESSHHWTDDVDNTSESLSEKESAREEQMTLCVNRGGIHVKENAQTHWDGHERNQQATARATRD